MNPRLRLTGRTRKIDMVLVGVKRDAEQTLCRFGLGDLLKNKFGTVQVTILMINPTLPNPPYGYLKFFISHLRLHVVGSL